MDCHNKDCCNNDCCHEHRCRCICPQGAQGPRGKQGLQGPKGDKGDKGDQGPPGSNLMDCCLKALSAVLKKLKELGISVQITVNGTQNAVPSSGAVPSEVTDTLVLFGNTIIPLCGIEDIQFTEADVTKVIQIVAALIETKNNIPEGCKNTCGEQLRQRIESGGNIRTLTSKTLKTLINNSNKPIVATGLSTVLLREGSSGGDQDKYHLVSLCQVSVLEYIPPPPPPPA